MHYSVKSICLFIITLLLSFTTPNDFLTEQKKFSRVKTALKEKGKVIEQTLTEKNIALSDLNILIVAFKEEQQLDLYAKKKSETTFRKLITYNICSSSGKPGPKRKIGDGQVPEDIIILIDSIHPVISIYHLV